MGTCRPCIHVAAADAEPRRCPQRASCSQMSSDSGDSILLKGTNGQFPDPVERPLTWTLGLGAAAHPPQIITAASTCTVASPRLEEATWPTAGQSVPSETAQEREGGRRSQDRMPHTRAQQSEASPASVLTLSSLDPSVHRHPTERQLRPRTLNHGTPWLQLDAGTRVPTSPWPLVPWSHVPWVLLNGRFAEQPFGARSACGDVGKLHYYLINLSCVVLYLLVMKNQPLPGNRNCLSAPKRPRLQSLTCWLHGAITEASG